MDRTKAKQLAGGITGVVILTIIALYSVGAISEQACIIMFFSIIAVYLGADYLINRNMGLDYKEQNERHLHVQFKKKKVQRTREGTIFEVVTALILIGSLVIGVATHTMELRDSIWNGYAVCFIGAIAGLILAYHPLFIWSPTSCHVTNVEQFKLLIRKHRVYAIESALMVLILSISPIRSHLLFAVLICLFIAWLGTDFLFSFLLNKNK